MANKPKSIIKSNTNKAETVAENDAAVTAPTTSPVDETPAPAPVDTEKEAMRQQLAEMQKQMELLMAGVNLANAPRAEAPASEKSVTIVNMTSGTFVLRGSRIYSLAGQFAKRPFTEFEARTIVSNMPNAVAEGKIYIADAEFVKSCNLQDTYRTLLSDEDLKNLLSHDASFVLEVYKNASKGQQEIIVSMVENKLLNAEAVDANVVVQLSKLCGKDLLGIEPLEDDESK